MVIASYAMLSVLIVFAICLLSTETIDSICPPTFDCSLDNDGVFQMSCKKNIEKHLLGRYVNNVIYVEIGIDEMPTNVSRLEISCLGGDIISKRITLNLHFKYIPQLLHLKLSDLKIENPVNNSMFSNNMQHLKTLTISGIQNELWPDLFNKLYELKILEIVDSYYITYIDGLLFHDLRSLEKIVLQNLGHGSFRIPIKQLESAISDLTRESSKLDKVYLNKIFIKQQTLYIENLFSYKTSNITQLKLNSNKFKIVNGNLIETLPKLERLSITNNKFVNLTVMSALFASIRGHRELKYLDFSDETRVRLPKKHLYISALNSFNKLKNNAFMIEFHNNLRSIDIHGMVIWNYFENMISINNKNSLRYLDMSSVQFIQDITINFDLEKLEYLSIQNTNMVLNNVSSLNKLINLKTLLMSNNEIGDLLSKSRNLFQSNILLEVLDLSACQLVDGIPGELMIPLSNLRIFNISRNRQLRSIQDINFSILTHLELINMSDCNIQHLTAETLQQFNGLINLTIDISQNKKLKCTNHLINWLKQLEGRSSSMFSNIKDTYCVYQNGTKAFFEKILIHRKNIDKTKAWIKILIILMACIIFTILLLILIWKRYKWTLALYLYNRKKKYRNKKMPPNHMERIFAYDTYICYSKGDRDWVLHTLVPRLESSGLRTLIHERDYLPGAIIENAIQESIDNSRWTILVITKNFLASEWCMRELQLANVENTKRKIHQDVDKLNLDDLVIPIVLDSKSTCIEDIATAGILHQSFLQWPMDSLWTRGLDDRMKLFWDKLITKLKTGGNLKRKS